MISRVARRLWILDMRSFAAPRDNESGPGTLQSA
jgi:hypothetical protein